MERPVKPQADRQRHERTRSGQVTRAHALPARHFAQRLLQEPPLLAHEEPPLRSHHCHVPKRSHGHRQLAASPNCSSKSRLHFVNFIEIRGKPKHHLSVHNQEASGTPRKASKTIRANGPTPEYESRAKVLTMFPCTPFKNARYLIATTNCFTQNTISRSANARGVDGCSIRMEEGSPQ